MNKKIIIFIILIVIGLGVESALLLGLAKPIPKTIKVIPLIPPTGTVKNIAPVGGTVVQITLTKDGFVPPSITIHPNDKVIWTNNSGKEGTVNSDNHPTHLLYPFLNLGNFPPGQTLRLIFKNKGVFTYHNHLQPFQKGTVKVE